MNYRHLGRSGLRVSEISYGSWVTFAKDLDLSSIRRLMHLAFDEGVNFFDNAEVYASGEAEKLMGDALKEFRREDLVVSTKIFWGGYGPNDTGLSRKHLIEGTRASLKRMKLDYVDLLFCHRPDPNTPIIETVLAMDFIIRQGWAFYWGTSEWPATAIRQAHQIAKEYGVMAPVMEQPEYSLFNRHKVESEYLELYDLYGMGTTIWSPLAGGMLTGKYNDAIPSDSRFAKEPGLARGRTPERIEKVRKLTEIARELGVSTAQLAIGWCLANPNVSTVITGATTEAQLRENLGASAVTGKLTPELMERINVV